MDYIRTDANGQQIITQSTGYLKYPSCFYGFTNTETVTASKSGNIVYKLKGMYKSETEKVLCDCCKKKMHVNNHINITLNHIPYGGGYSEVSFDRNQYCCPKCGKTKIDYVSFKAPCHRVTVELHQYVCDLLASGNYTNKEISNITGLGKNVVKEIDLERLKELYVTPEGKLAKPEKHATYLGIDEFKLHDGHQYATHIIDMENGHILWIARGKKKQVVYDFIEHVGLEWMSHVKAVACDMNSDFEEAFKEKCNHIQVVFDHFHIIKNFNDKVVSEIRKDEQQRLLKAGNVQGAISLKKSKHILTASRKTLQEKDRQAAQAVVIKKGSNLFNTNDYVRKGGNEERYDKLLKENELLFTLDLIKDKLDLAFSRNEKCAMENDIRSIIDICESTGNRHLLWFKKLLENHLDGITAFAVYKISAGKIEGINNKIKTFRRQGYGYPDDEYFFLKLIDISRKTYIGNPESHKFCD